jgi:hypothetical protein
LWRAGGGEWWAGLLVEAEGEPGLYRVDRNHPEDANVVPLQRRHVVDDVELHGRHGRTDVRRESVFEAEVASAKNYARVPQISRT